MFTCYPKRAYIGCCCGKHGGLATHSHPYLLRLPTPSENLLLKKQLYLDVNTTLPGFFFILLLIDEIQGDDSGI